MAKRRLAEKLYQEGREEGREEMREEMVQVLLLLEQGLEIVEIAKITGLSVNFITKLKNIRWH